MVEICSEEFLQSARNEFELSSSESRVRTSSFTTLLTHLLIKSNRQISVPCPQNLDLIRGTTRIFAPDKVNPTKQTLDLSNYSFLDIGCGDPLPWAKFGATTAMLFAALGVNTWGVDIAPGNSSVYHHISLALNQSTHLLEEFQNAQMPIGQFGLISCIDLIGNTAPEIHFNNLDVKSQKLSKEEYISSQILGENIMSAAEIMLTPNGLLYTDFSDYRKHINDKGFFLHWKNPETWKLELIAQSVPGDY